MPAFIPQLPLSFVDSKSTGCPKFLRSAISCCSCFYPPPVVSVCTNLWRTTVPPTPEVVRLESASEGRRT
jgi:hypothetical protein